MVPNLMPVGLDPRHQVGVLQSAFADEEEGGFGLVAPENIENLGSEGRVRSIVERQCHQRKIRSHSIRHVRSEPLDHVESSQRLYPKHRETDRDRRAD